MLEETRLEVLSDTGAGSVVFLFFLVIFRHRAESTLTPVFPYRYTHKCKNRLTAVTSMLWKLSAMFLELHDGKTEVPWRSEVHAGRTCSFLVMFAPDWLCFHPVTLKIKSGDADDMSNASRTKSQHKKKKMPMTFNGFYHLFQRCPWKKWCQKHQRQAYTCTWWRHMNWRVYGVVEQGKSSFLFVLCPVHFPQTQ